MPPPALVKDDILEQYRVSGGSSYLNCNGRLYTVPKMKPGKMAPSGGTSAANKRMSGRLSLTGTAISAPA